MKEILLIFVLMLISVSANAQLKGLDYQSAVQLKFDSDEEFKKNKGLLLKNTKGRYFIFFGKPTRISVKNAVEKSIEICNDNQMDFDKPDTNKSILDDSVDSIYNFKKLSHSLVKDESSIEQIYHTTQGSFVLAMNKDVTMVVFVNY